jgi:hypothetical protein
VMRYCEKVDGWSRWVVETDDGGSDDDEVDQPDPWPVAHNDNNGCSLVT